MGGTPRIQPHEATPPIKNGAWPRRATPPIHLTSWSTPIYGNPSNHAPHPSHWPAPRDVSTRSARGGGVGRLPWQPRGGGAAAPHAPHARTYARASSRSVPARHARPRPFRFCAPLWPSPERQPPPRGSRTNPPKKGTEIRPTGTNCNGNRNRSPPGSLGTWPRGGGGRASTPRLR